MQHPTIHLQVKKSPGKIFFVLFFTKHKNLPRKEAPLLLFFTFRKKKYWVASSRSARLSPSAKIFYAASVILRVQKIFLRAIAKIIKKFLRKNFVCEVFLKNFNYFSYRVTRDTLWVHLTCAEIVLQWAVTLLQHWSAPIATNNEHQSCLLAAERFLF